MREFQRKQRIKKWVYSLPVLALLALMSGILMKGAWGVVGKQAESSAHVQELEQRANTLSARTDELEERVSLLETEEGRIKEIKEKYSVSEEGEYVVVLVDEPSRATTTQESEEKWGQKWWNFIKNLWQD